MIGAGFSGICMGIKFLEAGNRDFIILEKEKEIGGTWYKNRYPGAACDVPSHFYCFSFAPNPNWSHVYSPQMEIKTYLKDCAEEFGVQPHIRFDSEVELIRFDESTALWHVSVAGGRDYSARHVVIGSGGLNTPNIPHFSGLGNFTGEVFHTACWPKDVDLSGKNVALIGSAASAVQIVPEVAKIAKRVMIFQRTPNYIAPRLDRAYTKSELEMFRKSAWRMKMLRLRLFLRYEFFLTPLFLRRSWLRRVVAKRVNDHMRNVIKDPELQKKLVPDYELGCKRILISDDYFPALNRENVSVITDGISNMDETGVVDALGKHHDADVIVLATGFDLKKQMQSIEMIGREGLSLKKLWAEDPAAFQGAMVPGFPNAYFVTGPNTGVGSTSVIYMIEAQAALIMKCLGLAGKERLIEPTQAAYDDYNLKLQNDLANTVWATDCSSWYKDEEGRISTLYPRAGRQFKREKLRLRLSDFDIRQKSDRQLTNQQIPSQ
ncbi:MAG: NAD(P)/FAD-dependent oxidoreductase [Proteobacteria bacterium]|nr:NAD(P)/FAD-dependent oxidoreductase [Pseudomonadota bacterium]